MEEVYNRKYSLEIGRSVELIKRTIPSTIIKPGGVESTPSPAGGGYTDAQGNYHDFLIVPAKSIKITELRITADVTYTKEGKSNKQGCIITIYNLSKANQNRIRTEDTVLLRAGYDKDGVNPPLIFAGQVKYMSTEKKDSDVITKLVCTEGEVARKNIIISRTPVRNETSRDIANWFSEIAAANGIPKGNVFVPVEIPYPSGYPAAGKFFTVLEEFCSNTNLQFYMTLGRLYIEAIDLTPVTSLLSVNEENVKGSIRREDDSVDLTSSETGKDEGIVFSTFLNGNITPSTVIDIKYGEYKGRYNMSSVQHKLDLEGNDWDTTISCKRRTEKELANGIFGI